MKTALYTLGTILTIYGGFSWLTKWTSGVPRDEIHVFLTLMIIGIVLLFFVVRNIPMEPFLFLAP